MQQVKLKLNCYDSRNKIIECLLNNGFICNVTRTKRRYYNETPDFILNVASEDRIIINNDLGEVDLKFDDFLATQNCARELVNSNYKISMNEKVLTIHNFTKRNYDEE